MLVYNNGIFTCKKSLTTNMVLGKSTRVRTNKKLNFNKVKNT
ncbi:hypothetical protein [Clostridium sp.]